MQKTRPALLGILMITAALAGCVSEDTSDLDATIDDLNATIDDLNSMTTNLAQTLEERDMAISELEATIAGHESNIAGLEAAMTLMEEQRDSLLAQLSDSQEFANQTIALAEAMNETIAGLHAMLGENATLVQQLQSDLAVQVDLVGQWQDTAWDNRASLRGADLSGANLSGADLTFVDLRDTILIGVDLSGADLRLAIMINADLSGADLSGASLIAVTWYNTICPDGTNSDDNGSDCDDNL